MSQSGSRRSVLLIGVSCFDPPPLAGEPGLDREAYDPLPFVPKRIETLAKVFREYQNGGFDVGVLLDPTRDQIRDAITAAFDDRDLVARVVHVISHGRHNSTDSTRLEVVPRCRRTGSLNNVHEWVSQAQGLTAPTLFLVDLCRAGRVVNLSHDRELEASDLKAWVIAASRSDEDALDGRFSEVFAALLGECAANGLDVGSRLEFVPIAELARRVRDALRGHQNLTSTTIQLHTRIDHPFLPNPRWKPDQFGEAAKRLDGSLRDFLEDVVAGAEHFMRRAGAHFTGRHAQLDRLVPWMNGAEVGSLRLVTGTAGAGKSALLGALVCAAHPDLLRVVPQVREALSHTPDANPRLAAVHARQRRLDELLESIARQLALPREDGQWTSASLIAGIIALPQQPLLVVDALDECLEYGAVQALLLLPLAKARRPNGGAACRLLVGARPWDQFRPLRDAAERQHGLIDLDKIDPEVLREDLKDYILALLGPDIAYAEHLATGVAAVLAADHAQRMHTPAEQRWGHFLVAGRYTEYLSRHPASSMQEADELAAYVPTELPGVLELVLSDHPDPRALRATLAAMAFAKGDGMPLELIPAVSAKFNEQAVEVLGDDYVRLYMRIGTEANGTGLYRLYHQGLADYLREHPTNAGHTEQASTRVLEALLATRTIEGTSDMSWEHAPSYLKRHAIQHASDALQVDRLLVDMDFLVHADPATLILELDTAASDDSRLAAAIYRTSYHLFRADPSWRRRILELNALRYTSGLPADPAADR